MNVQDLFRGLSGPPRLLGWIILLALLASCEPAPQPPPPKPPVHHRHGV